MSWALVLSQLPTLHVAVPEPRRHEQRVHFLAIEISPRRKREREGERKRERERHAQVVTSVAGWARRRCLET